MSYKKRRSSHSSLKDIPTSKYGITLEQKQAYDNARDAAARRRQLSGIIAMFIVLGGLCAIVVASQGVVIVDAFKALQK